MIDFGNAPLMSREMLFWRSCEEIEASGLPGSFVEFGTARGASARLILQRMGPDRKLYLFDSFQGIPEPFYIYQVGSFACDPPEIDDERVRIVVGWFDETVRPWARSQREPIAFVHLDADLYSSTLDALEGIASLLQVGTRLIFDQIRGDGESRLQTEAEANEQRAWLEFAEAVGIECCWWGLGGRQQAACTITKIA